MDQKEIIKYCIEKGILLDTNTLGLLKETTDMDSVKVILEKIRNHTQRRIITRELLEKNKKYVNEFFLELPEENQKKLEKFKIKLGLEIEISKETNLDIIKNTQPSLENFSRDFEDVKILSKIPSSKKKIELNDFVKIFRNRYVELRKILQEHQELNNLVSINKLSRAAGKVSIIGIIYSKRITKNGNILFDVEDLTGNLRVLVNQNKPELYKKARDISLDSVIGFTGFGDKEIFFVDNIVFPDAVILEKKKSPVEETVAFIGDLQYGSKLFFKENFNKFIDYLNGKIPNLKGYEKIKYLLIVGDLVSGVGVYPNQIKDLEIKDIEEQFQRIADILGRIRKDIKIIISPGNHDGVRLMEPQPRLDEKYAWPLYNMKNILFTGNPSYLTIGAKSNFPGIDILVYHGFSYPYYANNIPSLIKEGLNAPEKIMSYLLKNRHLAPTHSSIQYLPFEKDEHVIKNVPDVFVSGHTHKMAISSYNGVTIISTATWEKETENQKRWGNHPDFCKVPILNLKTREIKILDFE